MEEVLDPGVVGVTGRWEAVDPALVLAQAVAAPIGHVERRVGEDVIGFEIGMEVLMEGIGVNFAEIVLNAADGEVHLGKTPGGGVGLLPEDGEVLVTAAVCGDELFGLDEHAAGAAAGVVDAAFVGGEHFDENADDGAGRVELAALLALRAGELTEEILVDAAEDIAGAVLAVTETNAAEEVDELTEAGLIEGGAGEVLGEDALEGGILLFDGEHGIIDERADLGLPGAALEE